MRLWRTGTNFAAPLALSLCAFAFAGCQTTTDTNANVANTTTANANLNANLGTNANATAPATSTVGAREPDKYSATMVVRAAATGQQGATAQTEIKIARNGADRRYSFDTRIPGVGEIIFLDKADKRYVILPARKQYVELSGETTGMQVPRTMTPGQMVDYVERQQGVTRVGEETINGREAVKYRYAGQAQTGSQAGQVTGESFIWVDKATGLPLRIEGYGSSTGNVQGVSGGQGVMEMTNLSTDVNPADFEVPTGYGKVTEQELRQTAGALLGFLQAMSGAGAQGGAAPPATASPAPTR